MNVYIYKEDSSITETKTITSFTAANNTYVRQYLSIAKSWYKISKITITWSSTNSSSWNYAQYNLGVTDKDYGSSTNPSYSSEFVINYWPNNTGNTSSIYTSYNWTTTTTFQIPNSSIIFNWTNTTSIEITPDTYKLVINGNTYSGNYSSTNKRDIEYIFENSTVCFYAKQNSWTSSDVVATITYEPI